ncbi:nucleotidyltransferase family protein [Algoriphagus namhaensis]
MLDLVENKKSELEELCKRFSVEELFLFGSAAKASTQEPKDLDFAVTFSSILSPIERGESYFRLGEALELLFQMEIDLVSYSAIRNPIFKEELDNSKAQVYAR